MTKKLWGSRFSKKTSALTDRFTSSISFDKRLARYDVLGSIAHAKMLGLQKIIPSKDASLIVKGLNSILKDVNRLKDLDTKEAKILSERGEIEDNILKTHTSIIEEVNKTRKRHI